MRRTACVAAALTAAFLFLAAPFAGLAGLGHDEGWHLQAALHLAGAPKAPPMSFWPSMPLMRDEYNGSLKTFLLVPPAAAFGSSPKVLRRTTLAIGALFLILLVLFVTELEGLETAALLGAVLACHPALVLTSVYDFGPGIVMAALKAGALLLLLRAWRGGGRVPALAGGLALGLALWDKAHFLWFLAAAPLAALVVAPRRALAFARSSGPAVAAGAIAGALPFLLYNLLRPLTTFKHHASEGWTPLRHVATAGRHLPERAAALMDALTGAQQFPGAISIRPGGTDALLFGLAAAGALLAVRAAARREGFVFRRAAFWLALTALVFAAAVLTPAPVKWHHLFLAYPLPHLAAAAFIGAGLRAARGPWSAARALAWSAAAVVVAFNVFALSRYRRELQADGGNPHFFEGAAKACGWLEEHARSHPDAELLVDDELAVRCAIYLGGRVAVRQLPARPELPPGDVLVSRPGAAALVYEDERRDGAPFLKALGLKAKRSASFPLRDGRPWAAGFLVDPLPGAGRKNVGRAAPALPTPVRHRPVERADPLGGVEPKYWEAVKRGDSAAALELAEKRASLAPDDADAWIELAAASLAAGKSAEKALERAADLPMSPVSARRVAALFERTGERERALATLDVLVSAEPKDGALLADRGLARFQAGRKDEALADLELAVKLAPRFLPAYLTLGAIHEAAGRRAEADAVYARALAFEPLPEHRALRASFAAERAKKR